VSASLSQMKKERPCIDHAITCDSCCSISANFRGKVVALPSVATLLQVLLVQLTLVMLELLNSEVGSTTGMSIFLSEIDTKPCALLPVLLIELERLRRPARVILLDEVNKDCSKARKRASALWSGSVGQIQEHLGDQIRQVHGARNH